MPVLALACLSDPMQAKDVKDASAPKAEAIRLAIEDLARTHGDGYPGGAGYLERLEKLQAMTAGPDRTDALDALRREALLANPAVDFEEILLIRRREKDVSNVRKAGSTRWRVKLGIGNNFNGNYGIPGAEETENQLVALTLGGNPKLREVYRPGRSVLVCDVDLHWDGQKMLFSSLDETGQWHVYEADIDACEPRKLTHELDQWDVHSYSACYLPDDRILFVSTVTEQTVPCTGGDQPIGNLCRMNADGTGIRRLCFDQDQNWTPAVSNQGTILYTRWQYSDQAHRYPRILMQMNPDGTNQRDFYGSNSYWPVSLFYVRPIPGSSSRFVGIVSGHHGVPRMGEMILFDRKLGQREGVATAWERGPAPGVVQRITDRGQQVRSVISDKYADGSWPKFLYPYPLDGKTFLVSAKPTPDSHWGVYLVDVFDNMVPLHEEPGYAMFEPLPLKARPRPPVIPDQIDLKRKDATVYISDIYAGPGLAGVPRGTVKELQLYTFNFPPFYEARRRNVSTTNALGIASAWDVHCVLGRVPVEPDGSARFTVPANTPIALQPLDAEGKAMQVMRAWMTAMPGENLSCVGCHEHPDTVPPAKLGAAFNRAPSEIRPWHGPTRPFDFRYEVQPVLDRRCVGCHDGSRDDRPDLRSVKVDKSVKPMRKGSRVLPQDFSWAYFNLQRYVWRPTGESEMPILMPMEHHADASELVQMLRKGHNGVKLEPEEWDRIITWIDMNAPYYGTWQDAPRTANAEKSLQRRRELIRRFAFRDWQLGWLPQAKPESPEFIRPEPMDAPKPVKMDGWPLEDPGRLRESTAETVTRTIELPGRRELTMVWVPPGSFVMGSVEESPAERPMAPVKIEKGFWMSATEIDNGIYRLFDPAHHSRFINQTTESMWTKHLRSMNELDQPVVRVSWQQARAFCKWLSERTGENFDLPTEAQWEWAARAGSDRGFPRWAPGKTKGIANCAGVTWGRFYSVRKSLSHRLWNPDWDDEQVETDKVTANAPNAWGLKNMHGNAAEWTRCLYRPYPYRADDGRNDPTAEGRRVVRGGSFSDRPKRCTASYRLGYHPWQGVYNVGFRVIIRPGRRVARNPND